MGKGPPRGARSWRRRVGSGARKQRPQRVARGPAVMGLLFAAAVGDRSRGVMGQFEMKPGKALGRKDLRTPGSLVEALATIGGC